MLTNKIFNASALLEQVGISIVVCINVQYMITRCLNPFGRDSDELENKGLDSAGGIQSKFKGSQSLHNNFIEVSDESCHMQEYCILCYDDFGNLFHPKNCLCHRRCVPCHHEDC